MLSPQTLKARDSTRFDIPHMTRSCILSVKNIEDKPVKGWDSKVVEDAVKRMRLFEYF
jgi:hypothetical protein